MEIIIEYSKTKREINGPFNICGSREDLRSIAKAILDGIGRDFCFGWINITERQQDIVDTEPLPWDTLVKKK